MWNRIKRWFGGSGDSGDEPGGKAEYDFKWYEVGPENPFPMRVLDIRSLTWNVLSMTQDINIANSFNAQRETDGQEFIDADIENAKTIPCRLVFPHNGDPLEGIVFKADSMEVKWDIYIYDLKFLFVRSWTGQLIYRAAATIGADSITIHSIETAEDPADAVQTVYFLMGTHAMRRVLPHQVPREMTDPEQIASFSFSRFGNLACYATYDEITTIPISRPQSEA